MGLAWQVFGWRRVEAPGGIDVNVHIRVGDRVPALVLDGHVHREIVTLCYAIAQG